MLSQRRFFIACLVLGFAVLQSLLWTMVNTERQQRAETLRFSALQHLATQRAELEGRLNANLVSMRGLQADILIHSEFDPTRIGQLTERLLDEGLHTRHIAIAPDLVIRYIHPLLGNEQALGLDYREQPEQLASVMHAIERGDVVIQPPVSLAQGGTAMIARTPVILDDGDVWGIISQVIDYPRLLTDVGIGRATDTPYHTALRVADVHVGGEPSLWQAHPVTLSAQIGSDLWELGAVPENGEWKQPVSHFWLWFVAGNLAIALILGLLAFAFLNHRRLQHAFNLITQQAQTDPLTGLLNRSYLRELLARHINYCAEHNEQFCVLFIDLDHFKQVNDSLGHEIGDELLVLIATRLRHRLRDRDLIARLGGDEFVVVLTQVDDLETSMNLAQQIHHTLSEPFHVVGHKLHVHSSIGIALYPNDGQDVSTLLKHADIAMYTAKSAGRHTSAFFDASMQKTAESQLRISNELREGINAGQFRVFYQPIVDRQGHVSHVEALARWQHPEHGLLSPAYFIEIAERTGAIHALGDFVLAQACNDLHTLQQQWPNLKLTVNRSSVEFNDAANPSRWLHLIKQAQIQPNQVIFEITESMLMPQLARQHAMIAQLQQHGIVFAIDDFGSGYSSVNYVRRFPISLLKIDQSFVTPLPNDQQARAMVGALVQMAQALDIKLLAEGVSDAGKAECLRELGVDYLQGYVIAKPLPLDALTAWLANQTVSE